MKYNDALKRTSFNQNDYGYFIFVRYKKLLLTSILPVLVIQNFAALYAWCFEHTYINHAWFVE